MSNHDTPLPNAISAALGIRPECRMLFYRRGGDEVRLLCRPAKDGNDRLVVMAIKAGRGHAFMFTSKRVLTMALGWVVEVGQAGRIEIVRPLPHEAFAKELAEWATIADSPASNPQSSSVPGGALPTRWG